MILIKRTWFLGVKMYNSTRALVSSFGALVGLIGIEHGLGEILQGNAAPSGLMFPSWPGSAFFQILNGEPAISIIPNLLFTGILAILASLAYLAWSILLVDRRHSSLVLALISILMLLFGGGIFPPIFGLLLAAAATRINSPLTWCRKHLSPGVRRSMGAIWPWAFGAALFSWLSMFPGIPVLSYYFGLENETLIFILLAGMFGFLILSSVTGSARDSRKQTDSPS